MTPLQEHHWYHSRALSDHQEQKQPHGLVIAVDNEITSQDAYRWWSRKKTKLGLQNVVVFATGASSTQLVVQARMNVEFRH